MSYPTRTHYVDPTDDQIADEVYDLLARLGYYRPMSDAARKPHRDALALRIADALPSRIHRVYAGAVSE